jgi:hypothetical protein
MKIRLTKSQWERISEISGNFGLLIVASFVFPSIANSINISQTLWGIVISLSFWYISIIIARKY